MKMVIAAPYFWGVQMFVIQAPNQNTLIVQSIFKYLEYQEMPFHHHHQACLINSLIWSGPDAIVKTCNPMQNPGQTWMVYKPGKTCLSMIWTKHDPVRPVCTHMHAHTTHTPTDTQSIEYDYSYNV